MALPLLVLASLTGCEPAKRPIRDSGDSLTSAFAHKRECYQLARQKWTTEEQDSDPSDAAEWCYDPKLNTCIYATTKYTDKFIKFKTLDLLTNHVRWEAVAKADAEESRLKEYFDLRGRSLAGCL